MDQVEKDWIRILKSRNADYSFLTQNSCLGALNWVPDRDPSAIGPAPKQIMLDKKRIYVFKDLITGKEKECTEASVVTLYASMQLLNGITPRFQFMRSYIPKVKAVKQVTRTSGNETMNFERITEVEETEIRYEPPRIVKKDGLFKLETTWLSSGGGELPGSPLEKKVGR